MIPKLILTSVLMMILGGIATTILSDGFLTYEYFFDFSDDTSWFQKIMSGIVIIGVAGIILFTLSIFAANWVV